MCITVLVMYLMKMNKLLIWSSDSSITLCESKSWITDDADS